MPYLTKPPDPNPKVPRIKAPPGAWDCQLHLFGPVDRYPMDPTSPYTSDPALPETALRLMETLGIWRAIIVSGGGYGYDYRFMADTLERLPERFLGVIFPSLEMPSAEWARLHGLGVRGVRFVSDKRAPNLPRLDSRLAGKAHDMGWPIHFYPHGEDILVYGDQLLALPNEKIVLDHFAAVPAEKGTDQPAFRKVLEMLDTGRVWIKMSGAMHCTKEEFPYRPVTQNARALVKHAPERLVWCSDWPHVNMNNRVMPNDGDLFDLLGEWAPEEADRRMILVDNPRALYGA